MTIYPQQLEDFRESNESSLQMLVRAIELSEGEFSLIVARCNYTSLRDRMVKRLRELSPVNIRVITLNDSVTTLYTTIAKELGSEKPAAVMVFGLELVTDLDLILISTNLVREEFKNFPFLLVLWVNDPVLTTMIQVAPDFNSWARTCNFTLTTPELVDLLYENAERMFSTILEVGDQFIPNSVILNYHYRQELDSAQNDLQSRTQKLAPEIEASLGFIRARDKYANNQIDEALTLYQESLSFWQEINNLVRQGIVLFYIGLCYYRKADLQRSENYRYWQEARDYFQQCLDIFEREKRPDLVAKFIGQLGKVLQRLEAWEDLQNLARKAISLHENYGSTVLIAQDYGFLAEVALEKYSISRSIDLAKEAEKLALQALKILGNTPKNQQYQGLYLLLLARSQKYLNQQEDAIANLEKARESSIPQSDPLLYLRILTELQSLYYDRKHYLKAFKIKQQQSAIQQQYGFRAFIGASRLQPQAQGIRQEEPVFGREQDVDRLINERISSENQKLTVIHGQSGVGKSSIIDAGLVPLLKGKNIGSRKALPVLLRVYRDWIGAVGQALAEALKEIRNIDLPSIPNSLPEINEQLQENNKQNLLTVFIFDQFEEFLFTNTQGSERQQFYGFLKNCLNSIDIQFVRVILSIREDYLHNLLEYERFVKLNKTNNDIDILSEKNRYYIGNFSPEDAKSVIQSLTERSQFNLEPALVNELVQDLAVETGEVRPIELQVVGAQLEAKSITTLAKYREGNTKTKLVQQYLYEVIKYCGSENERAAQLILYSLTDEKTIRPLKTKGELKADVELQDEQLNLVLEILEGSGLVFRIPEVPEDRYQLVHDYLVPLIRKKQEPLVQVERGMRQLDEKGLNHTFMELEKLLHEAIRKRLEQEQRQEEQVSKWVEIAENETLKLRFQSHSISEFADFNKVLSTLINDLKKLRDFAKKLKMEKTIFLIDDVVDRVQKTAFSIAVVGEFKRGKSTFINALLGQEILPVDVLPCSAALNRVAYGVQPLVKIVFRNGREEEVAIDKLADYVTMLTPESEKTAASVKEAVVYYPVDYCQNYVNIIDTPGLHNLVNMNEIVLSVLPQVDVAIMVTMAQYPFTEYEREFIETQLLTHDLGRIIFVVNGIDLYKNPGEAEKVTKYIQDSIKKFVMERIKNTYGEDSPQYEVCRKQLGTVQVFALSAYQALQAKVSHDKHLLTQSRFPEFEAALEKFITQERASTFLQVPVNRAINSAIELLKTISIQENALATKQEEFRVAYDNSVADIKAMRDKKFVLRNIINGILQEKEKQLQKNSIEQNINEQIYHVFDDIKQKIIQEAESLPDNIQNNLKELQAKLEQEEALAKPQRQELNQMKAETYGILGNAQRLSQQLIQQANMTQGY